MNLPRIAKRIFPDWNIRIYTPDEAEYYCKNRGINVQEGDNDQVDYGLYTVYENIEMIILNKFLEPEMRFWVFCHEIFHSAAHAPETSSFSPTMETKNDAEANTFSAIAIMPRPLVENRTVDEICHIYNFPRPLAEIRKCIADNQGI